MVVLHGTPSDRRRESAPVRLPVHLFPSRTPAHVSGSGFRLEGPGRHHGARGRHRPDQQAASLHRDSLPRHAVIGRVRRRIGTARRLEPASRRQYRPLEPALERRGLRPRRLGREPGLLLPALDPRNQGPDLSGSQRVQHQGGRRRSREPVLQLHPDGDPRPRLHRRRGTRGGGRLLDGQGVRVQSIGGPSDRMGLVQPPVGRRPRPDALSSEGPP